jgi:aconitate hydratase
MSPESGSTAAIFPIDEVTVDYLLLTGRTDDQLSLVEAYAKAQGMWHGAEKEPVFSEYIELDLVDVVPSIAGRSESYLVLTSRVAGIEPPIDSVFPCSMTQPDFATKPSSPGLWAFSVSRSRRPPAAALPLPAASSLICPSRTEHAAYLRSRIVG